MSKKSQTYTQRVGIALALAIGLTILSTVATPLLGDEIANRLPGLSMAYAEEADGHGG